MRSALLAASFFFGGVVCAQVTAPDLPPPSPAASSTNASSGKPAGSTPGTKAHPATMAEMQASLDQLAQSNRDLLDLLKRQQSVLQDIQYDRREQSRHISSLEARLEDSLQENAQLQKKVDELEAQLAARPAAGATPAQENTNTGAAGTPPTNSAPAARPSATNVVAADQPPTPPASYLPPPDAGGVAGGKSWHRLFTLKGTDGKQTDIFQVRGRTWRVLWHNQDPPDKKLKNTSGLFIDAFPKDDTIPQHVCAKVGSGGDTTDLVGPGNYYLKITASGGSWELAVEDLQ